MGLGVTHACGRRPNFPAVLSPQLWTDNPLLTLMVSTLIGLDAEGISILFILGGVPVHSPRVTNADAGNFGLERAWSRSPPAPPRVSTRCYHGKRSVAVAVCSVVLQLARNIPHAVSETRDTRAILVVRWWIIPRSRRPRYCANKTSINLAAPCLT